MKALIAGAALAVLGGCGMIAPPPPEEYVPMVICEGADNCAKMWRRAQAWIVNNSGMKIQSSSDAVVQTYNPPAYSTVWGFTLVRMPLQGEKESLDLRPTCGSAPICALRPWQMRQRFYQEMMPGQ